MPYLIVSLSLLGGKRCPFSFVPAFVAKMQDRSSLDPRVESFTALALPRSRDSPNGRLLCPVRAVKHYLSHTASHRPLLRTTVRHLRAHQEGDLYEYGLILAPPSNIAGLPTVGQTSSDSLPLSSGGPRYCSIPPIQKELCHQPGVEGRRLASSHHLHTPLPQGLVSQVTRHLTPRPCGGGAGHGLTQPLALTYPT